MIQISSSQPNILFTENELKFIEDNSDILNIWAEDPIKVYTTLTNRGNYLISRLSRIDFNRICILLHYLAFGPKEFGIREVGLYSWQFLPLYKGKSYGFLLGSIRGRTGTASPKTAAQTFLSLYLTGTLEIPEEIADKIVDSIVII